MADYFIGPSDLPISGRDEFTTEEKRRVIPNAQAQVRQAVVGDESITNPSEFHLKAIRAYASYMLAVGAYNPDDERYGDAINAGTRASEWADHYYQMYEDAIELLATDDGSGGNDDGNPETEPDPTLQFETY